MPNNDKVSWTISTFKITTELHDKVTKFNAEHPNDKINVSGTCREAIEQKVEWRIKQDEMYEGAKRT